MFRAIILPIFRSTRLCVTACGIMHPRCCRPATGRQHRGCIIPQAVTHSLVLLKMGEIIAWNMLSWLELLINCYCCIQFVVYIICISDARSCKHQICQCVLIYFKIGQKWLTLDMETYIDLSERSSYGKHIALCAVRNKVVGSFYNGNMFGSL